MNGLQDLNRSLGQRPRAVTLFGAPEGYDAAAIGTLATRAAGCMSAATTAGWRGSPRRCVLSSRARGADLPGLGLPAL